GAYTPGPVHRAVQQLHSAPEQLGTHAIDVIHLNGEHMASACLATGYHRRLDQLRRCRGRQQVDKRMPELEYGRVCILEFHRQPEDLAVELLAGLQVLDKQRDGKYTSRPRTVPRTYIYFFGHGRSPLGRNYLAHGLLEAHYKLSLRGAYCA